MPTQPRRVPLVQLVRISNPCPLAGRAWGQHEKSWHCPECDLDVHNFSAMTEAEAETVLAAGGAGHRVCARFTADRAGAPITADRPWALKRALLRHRLLRIAAGLGLATVLGLRLGGCATGGEVCLPEDRLDNRPPAEPSQHEAPPPAR